MSVDSAGKLWFYKGTGVGGMFQTKVNKGSGWGGYTLAAGADLNGDGKADIVGRKNSNGRLYFYRSTGGGGFAAKVESSRGW